MKDSLLGDMHRFRHLCHAFGGSIEEEWTREGRRKIDDKQRKLDLQAREVRRRIQVSWRRKRARFVRLRDSLFPNRTAQPWRVSALDYRLALARRFEHHSSSRQTWRTAAVMGGGEQKLQCVSLYHCNSRVHTTKRFLSINGPLERRYIQLDRAWLGLNRRSIMMDVRR
jgi:hypothetical protein